MGESLQSKCGVLARSSLEHDGLLREAFVYVPRSACKRAEENDGSLELPAVLYVHCFGLRWLEARTAHDAS